MAKSNRDRVSEVMDALKDGLGPYVLREYKQYFKGSRYLQDLEQILRQNNAYYGRDSLTTEKDAIATLDAPAWLKAMMFGWNDVFRAKLGHS